MQGKKSCQVSQFKINHCPVTKQVCICMFCCVYSGRRNAVMISDLPAWNTTRKQKFLIKKKNYKFWNLNHLVQIKYYIFTHPIILWHGDAQGKGQAGYGEKVLHQRVVGMEQAAQDSGHGLELPELRDTGFGFWVVPCGARSWTQRSLWVSSKSEYPVITS